MIRLSAPFSGHESQPLPEAINYPTFFVLLTVSSIHLNVREGHRTEHATKLIAYVAVRIQSIFTCRYIESIRRADRSAERTDKSNMPIKLETTDREIAYDISSASPRAPSVWSNVSDRICNTDLRLALTTLHASTDSDARFASVEFL